jgi:PAS domain S-box-containing protein
MDKENSTDYTSPILSGLNNRPSLFRIFSEVLSQGIFLADFNGKILYANRRICQLIGIDNEQALVGKFISNFFHAASQNKFASDILPYLRRDGQWQRKLDFLSDGDVLTPVILQLFLLSSDDDAPLFFGGIVTDISKHAGIQKDANNVVPGEHQTQRIFELLAGMSQLEDALSKANQHLQKEVEERTRKLSHTNEKLRQEIARRRDVEKKLRESEHQFRAVVENQTELICRFLPDYTFTFVNDALCRYFSKTREELLGESFFPLLYEGDRKMIEDFYRTFSPERQNGTNEHRVLLKKGEVRWQQWSARAIYDEQNQLIEFQTVGRDITDRLKAEEALKDSEERYRIVAKHTADGILVIQNETLVFANDAFAFMCGYNQPDQLIGKIVEEVISSPYRKKFQHHMAIADAGGTEEILFRGKLIRPDGQEFWVEGLPTFIQWEGRPAVLSTMRDITAARHREMETKRETKLLRQQNIKLVSTIKDRFRFGNLVGKSPAMQEVYEQILSASSTNANVVVYGESGTGKELVANAIHDLSDRANDGFVPVNCGAIPENLMESEFFGHKKGAFTGADANKEGYLDFANGGTLFLDEVGDVSLAVQVKLLRAIEGSGHTPLGSNQVKKSDFRIIAATNRPLMEVVKKGEMREDFFFRIHIVPIYLPPLRERKEDILLLVEHFMRIFNKGKTPSVLSGKILDTFVQYEWPGNVRELQNVLQRYLAVGRLEFASGWKTDTMEPQVVLEPTGFEQGNFRDMVSQFEKHLIAQALQKYQWNRTKVATELGIPRRTLFNKMRHYELNLPDSGNNYT